MIHIKQLLPKPARRWLIRHSRWPRVGRVDFGDLHRTSPISRDWGGDRGFPVDRYYIEGFLAENAANIYGRVLEVGDNAYTLRFGADRVIQSDIFHAADDNPQAAFVGDLTHAPQIPSDTFDCIICTQTLQLIPNITAAIETLFRILKPGGVVLVTVPGISKIYRDEYNRWGDYWRFTTFSVQWLFTQVFPQTSVQVQVRGNVLVATAFLYGLAADELTAEELDYIDADYQLLLLIRAVKPTEKT